MNTQTSHIVPEGLTTDLVNWVHAETARGVPQTSLLNSMRDAGWKEILARRALGLPETGDLPAGYEPREPAGAVPLIDRHPTGVPEPNLKNDPSTIHVGDRYVHILMAMQNPRIVVFGNLLAEEECNAMIAMAKPRMQRSQTVNNASGGEEVHADRTSDGMFFQRGENELARKIEERIARLLNWPVENGEGLQVLHYSPGAEYKPHHDYFAPNEPGTPTILKRGGQRVGTLVMYLNEPARGGGTTFPDVGLQIVPRRGNAVFFSYDRPDPATKTLHGGAPVLEGEKWIATKWLREREFK